MSREVVGPYGPRSNIKFPSPLTDEDSKSLVRHLVSSKKFHSLHCNVLNSEVGYDGKFEERYIERVGQITTLEPYVSTTFNFFRDLGEENENLYNGIRFSSIGDQPNEVPEEEMQVWDQARKIIDNYFALKEQEEAILSRPSNHKG